MTGSVGWPNIVGVFDMSCPNQRVSKADLATGVYYISALDLTHVLAGLSELIYRRVSKFSDVCHFH